jgi:glutamate dehydrogenase
VISSSYEIIANLIMNDEDFMANKAEYIRDVLEILEKRAGDETRLIFARHKESGGRVLYTEISDAISTEINDHYARIFASFQTELPVSRQPIFRKVLFGHLPQLLRKGTKYGKRINTFPVKNRYAILAGEIPALIVYRGGCEPNLESTLRNLLKLHMI